MFINMSLIFKHWYSSGSLGLNQIPIYFPQFYDLLLFEQKGSQQQNSSMITNPNDPSGQGLFSKCGRSQASKLKPHRPSSAARNTIQHQSQDSTRKKSTTYFGFAKQQSRQQRQRKYKKDNTPPVGKYQPILQQRPKLVWDILRVYQSRSAKKKQPMFSPKENKIIESETIIQPSQEKLEQQFIEQAINSNMISLGQDETLNSSVNKSQCMVNMSRMTGRKSQLNESRDWGDSNVLNSIDYVRPPITKNVYFSKQRKDSPKNKSTINPASNYSYDYNILKPKKIGLLDFSSTKGRDQMVKNASQLAYQYQHYEYNKYVWNNNSSVFPNTKTHLIQFKKQPNRYRNHNMEQGLTS